MDTAATIVILRQVINDINMATSRVHTLPSNILNQNIISVLALAKGEILSEINYIESTSPPIK